MRVMIVVFVVVLVAACKQSAPTAEPRVASAREKSDRGVSARSVLERARAALTASLEMDYGAPFKPSIRLPARVEAQRLYLEACELGDLRACRTAYAFSPGDSDLAEAAGKRLMANCRANDIASCRAIDPNRMDMTMPGGVGRACEQHHSPETCDAAALKRECAGGFPLSCMELREFSTSEESTLFERARTLSFEGCRDGITRECFRGAEVPGLEEACNVANETCNDLAELYFARGDKIRARDAFERTCQLHDPHCKYLIYTYSKGWFPEPYPGRIRELIEHGCAHGSHDDACPPPPAR